MKTIKRHMLLLSIVASTIYGCGSGSTSTSENTSKYSAPIGPNSYPALQSLFTRHPNKNVKLSSNLSSSNNCGVTDADVATGLAAATGFVSIIPIAGPALGAITGATGSVIGLQGADAANACIQSEFNVINQELAVQESQIQGIETILNLTDNTFYQLTYLNAASIAGTDNLTFQTAISQFSGISNDSSNIGAMATLMEDIGFWNDFESPVAIPNNLASYMESNPYWYQSSYNVGVTAAKTTVNYASSITNIAGAGTNSSCIDSNESAYLCVVPEYDSAQILMYQSLYTSLTESVNNQQYSNYISLYDNYNNTLVQAYQQTIFALQQAYFMEYLNNQVNYNNAISQCIGTNTCPNQTTKYGSVPGTYFYVGTSGVNISNESSVYFSEYNEAQKQLTLLFAAYMNQAYLNTINYMVTDSVIGAQQYPTGASMFLVNGVPITDSNPINYSLSLGQKALSPMQYLSNNLATGTGSGDNGTGYLPSLGTSLQSLAAESSLMLYQYYGLNNTRVWAQSVFSANSYKTGESLGAIAANYESAPQLFINGTESFVAFDQGFAPGYLATPGGYSTVNPSGNYVNINQTIIPYYATPNSYPVLSGSVSNNINISACNPNAVGNIPGYALYWYIPGSASSSTPVNSYGIGGVPYLMCGNYQTTNIASTNVNYSPYSYFGEAAIWPTKDSYYGVNIIYGNYPCTYETSGFCGMPNQGKPITVMAWANYANGQPYTNWGTFINYNDNYPNVQAYTLGNTYVNVTGGYSSAVSQGNNSITAPLAIQITLPDGFIAPLAAILMNNPDANNGADNSGAGGATNLTIPETLALGFNPNVSIVQINNHNISESSNIITPYTPVNEPWGPSFTQIASGTNPAYAYPGAVVINGNMLSTYGSIPVTNDYQITGTLGIAINAYNCDGTYISSKAPASWNIDNNYMGGINAVFCTLSYYD